eukprot:Lithocolla_globosa_v1_NODE_4422_length_1438_cov_278.452639.p3 type:complete len:162 gc:universal NODE_4422_length_1438_cov_278.452639:43-528(+)
MFTQIEIINPNSTLPSSKRDTCFWRTVNQPIFQPYTSTREISDFRNDIHHIHQRIIFKRQGIAEIISKFHISTIKIEELSTNRRSWQKELPTNLTPTKNIPPNTNNQEELQTYFNDVFVKQFVAHVSFDKAFSAKRPTIFVAKFCSSATEQTGVYWRCYCF